VCVCVCVCVCECVCVSVCVWERENVKLRGEGGQEQGNWYGGRDLGEPKAKAL